MDAVLSAMEVSSVEELSHEIHAWVRRLLLPEEVFISELVVRSPRSGVFIATNQRVLFVLDEGIGRRMGCVPYNRIERIEHVRQRNTNTVHIMHTHGKILLTCADDRAVRRFVHTLRTYQPPTGVLI